MGALNLTVSAERANLAHLQTAIAAFAEENNWSAELTFHVDLVVEEIFINIASYGFDEGDTSGTVEVVLDYGPDEFKMEFIDNGRAFDPLHEAPAPELDADVAHRHIGGLGIFFVKEMMDDMRYWREADCNHLAIVKRREDRGED